jgi:DNA-binding NtrC family response regulator
MKEKDEQGLQDSLGERTVLVIDDSEAVRTALDVLLSMHGARVLGADSAAAGMDVLARESVDLVVQDMNFRREATSGEEGVTLFRHIRSLHPELPVILLTAWTHLETAVELVKAGASDYVAKPWDNARLLTTVRNLLDLQTARAENRAIRRQRAAARAALAARFELKGLVYESEAMQALASTAARVAHADVPVLISGPNGAGKEVIADIVQANSAVKSGPYVKVNLGALPDTLMEAELFGTEAGAFTGAKARTGRFEAADGGTIFLDELGNLSALGQAKLLRVLQTGEYERLGSNATRRTRARVIAATNANLAGLIREGRFREDLFYRLNVIELEVPPLAARQDDILPLAQHFLEPDFRLSQDALRALVRYQWPGNVRELRNVIHRACLLSVETVVTAKALALPIAPEPADGSHIDRQAIEQALSPSNSPG